MLEGGRGLAAIYDAMACGVVVRDADGAVMFANAAAHRIFGRPPEELLGSRALGGDRRVREDGSPMPDDEVPGVAALRGEPIRGVMMGMVRADGLVRWLLVDAVPVFGDDGAVRQVVSSFVDVTDRKKAERELERQALHDALTDLPNRTLLLDRLDQGIRTSRRHSTPLALLVMDLDRFKDVNDTFGHQAGDLLLREAAARLRHELRDVDTVARLGGDEFAILLQGTEEEGADQVARKIIETLQRPFEIGGEVHEIAVSIGIALCPRHGEDVDTLLRRADIAMYVAKRSSSGAAVYSEQREEEGKNQLALMAEFRHALKHDELRVMYQPIVGMEDKRAAGVEALARWRHPERGLVPPGEFVPLAERTGLVRQLFEHVLTTTLLQARSWHDAGVPLHAAVNVSPRNLLDPDLAAYVEKTMRGTDTRPEWLGFEITESMVMADNTRAIQTLHDIRSLGIEISIDDFGVGYSSLAYLQRLPAYAVKIDRSFVARMTRDRNSESIIELIIELAHSLGLQVIAEGIEDRATWNALAALSCDSAQGFFVAKPMVPAAIVAWMARSNRTSSGI
jgi:diguanylate cyclase (GGDEF)-like protein/PAS domain S-box-containing protein